VVAERLQPELHPADDRTIAPSTGEATRLLVNGSTGSPDAENGSRCGRHDNSPEFTTRHIASINVTTEHGPCFAAAATLHESHHNSLYRYGPVAGSSHTRKQLKMLALATNGSEFTVSPWLAGRVCA